MTLIHRVRIELERYPDLGRRADIADVELAGDDADDRIRIAGQRDALAKNVRIAVQTLRPEVVAQNDRVTGVRQILCGREPPAHDERRAQYVEILRAHLACGNGLEQ